MLFILSFVSFFKILQLAYPNYVYCWFFINNFDLFGECNDMDGLPKK